MIGDEDVFDIPPYPDEWDTGQRLAAYWHAVYHTNMPANTRGWYLVWKSLDRERERGRRVRATP